MSWINDVREEIHHLRSSRKDLKKFGLLVGSVCLLFAGLGYYRGWGTAGSSAIFLAGLGLLFCGIVIPDALKKVYKVWMALAFAIGWLVSRLILVILFFVVLTPVGLLARLFGKEFIETNFQKKKTSYWVSRPAEKKIDYEKLF